MQAEPPPLIAPAPPFGSVIWEKGRQRVVVVACASEAEPDPSLGPCFDLRLEGPGSVITTRGGYVAVGVIWKNPGGAPGPDVILRGDPGSSDGCVDTFVARFEPRLVVERYQSCHEAGMTPLSMRPDGPDLTLNFDLTMFNGSDAASPGAPLPLFWNGWRFEIETLRLRRAAAPVDEAALRSELAAQAPQRGLAYPQNVTLTEQALMRFILAGRVEAAQGLLQRVWPMSGPYAGDESREAFFSDLCAAMLHAPLWRRFDMDRMDFAPKVRAAAMKRAAPF